MDTKKKIFITVIHDLLILGLSFFLALWLRLEEQSFVLFNYLIPYLFLFISSTIFFLNRFSFYQGIWRYASMQEILVILKSLLASCLIIVGALFISIRLENIPRSFPILLFIVSLFGLSGPRIFYRLLRDGISNLKFDPKLKVEVIVVGIGITSELFIRASLKDKSSPYRVVGIIGSKPKSVGRTIHGIPIVGNIDKLDDLYSKLQKKIISAQRIIIADHTLSDKDENALFSFAKQNGLAIAEIPKITDLMVRSESESIFNKKLDIEDLLGRKQKVHTLLNRNLFKNRSVMVTGAGGSIGFELCKQILDLKPKKLILYEQSEFNLYRVYQKLKNENVFPVIGDVKEVSKLDKVFSDFKPDFVFHSAALKHITFVESDPIEAIKTNFFGTVNIVKSCEKYKTYKLIFISTDKAVNPTNYMGATKRLCEKYLQAYSKESPTLLKIVRFGNVLGSTGSVIPLFNKQIKNNGPLTITHPSVTRYFMTIREAVELVIIASAEKTLNKKNVINILEMGEPIRIKDLALKMIKLSGKSNKNIEIKYTNLRKGEKLHEELFYEQEKVTKTKNEGILETNSMVYPLDKKQFQNFLHKKNSFNEKKIIKAFCELLPEFKKENE